MNYPPTICLSIKIYLIMWNQIIFLNFKETEQNISYSTNKLQNTCRVSLKEIVLSSAYYYSLFP